jgi:hypothetical protein
LFQAVRHTAAGGKSGEESVIFAAFATSASWYVRWVALRAVWRLAPSGARAIGVPYWCSRKNFDPR